MSRAGSIGTAYGKGGGQSWGQVLFTRAGLLDTRRQKMQVYTVSLGSRFGCFFPPPARVRVGVCTNRAYGSMKDQGRTVLVV